MSLFKMQQITEFISKRKLILFSISILLLNFILKICFINANDIAKDEPFSIFHAQMPVSDIIFYLKGGNNPPLYEILLHFWVKLFGIEAFSVRLPSLIFSCLTALIIFRAGLLFFNFATAAAASMVYTFSSLHTYFAHEARAYPLFIFLVVLSFIMSLKFFHLKKTGYLIGLYIIDVLIIYTHYFGFFVLLCQFTGLFIFEQNKKHYKWILLTALLILLSFIPLLPSFMMQFFYSVDRGTWLTPPQINHFYGFINIFLNNKYVSIIYIALLCIILFTGILKKESIKALFPKIVHKNLVFLFLFFAMPYTVMFMASFTAPMFIERYVLFTSPFLYIFMAALISLSQIGKHLKIALLGIFIISMGFTYNNKPYNNREIARAVDFVKSHKTPQSIVLVCPDYYYYAFTYHYNQEIFKNYSKTFQLLADENIFLVSNQYEVIKILQEGTYEHIIYFQSISEFVDPKNRIYDLLKNHFNIIDKKYFHEIYTVTVFDY